MSLKSWVIKRIRREPGSRSLLSRVDLPPRDAGSEPSLSAGAVSGWSAGASGWDSRLPASTRGTEPGFGQGSSGLGGSLGGHLGDYAPLIDAVRQELEHFIVSQLRLHLAIADRDRYVLTSIAVHCQGDDHARDRLLRFMREFKPEQVKRYLVREVIAGLPNAAAIDLSQFGGLVDGEALPGDGADAIDDYRDLLAELQGPAADGGPAYEVTLLGRWSEIDAAPAGPSARSQAPSPAPAAGSLVTPLAGPRCEFEVEDADGRRRVVLPAVVAGRRYVVGKGEGCDIVVRGTYTSRRHAELWLDQGSWWCADLGSTNGIRIESPGAAAQEGAASPAGEAGMPLHPAEGGLRHPAEGGLRHPAEGGLRHPAEGGLRHPAEGGLRHPAEVGPGHPAEGTRRHPDEGGRLRLADGARLLLSARSDGPPADHPWLALRSALPSAVAARVTPIAAAPRTPLTAVMSGHAAAAFSIVDAAGGPARLALRTGALPLSIGRSRQSALVIDRRHDGVSGHHLDVVALDAAGADIVVVGDNGVLIGGTHHRPGARVRWPEGQPLVLGAIAVDAQACTLLLRRD
jgi:pSer/pThr/pTyr-binding forkhead associated (FHA) protein